jgi:hypothetical protein
MFFFCMVKSKHKKRKEIEKLEGIGTEINLIVFKEYLERQRSHLCLIFADQA